MWHFLRTVAAPYALLTGCSGMSAAIPTTGTLQLTVAQVPAGAPAAVIVSSGAGFNRGYAASATIGDLVPGSYTIAATAITSGGFTFQPTPAAQTVAVTAGSTASATVTYAATAGSLTINVSGLPGGVSANVAITGPGFGRTVIGTTTLTDLVAGSYTVSAIDVTVAGIAYTATLPTRMVDVTAGASATTTFLYRPGTNGFGNLTPGFQSRSMIVMGTTYLYQIFVPQGYTPTQKWPVILFLHGSGESGTDGVRQTTVGLGRYVSTNAETFPAIVVFPQVPSLSGGGQIVGIADSINTTALNLTLAEARADSSRIYVTGISQGAYLSWDEAYLAPTRFAAAVPIAGNICGACIFPGGAVSQDSALVLVAKRLVALPIWVFHGSADSSEPVVEDQKVVAAFRAAGSAIRYTEYAGLGHNVWDITYADPNLWIWLFAQHR